MCGIVYINRKDFKPARKSVLKRYARQKERGQEGFGFVALNGGLLQAVKRTKSESEIEKHLESVNAPEIIFHHRFPTSTINLAELAHPIKVSNKRFSYDYYIVHNGIIANADELKTRHDKKGIAYSTELKTQFLTRENTYEKLSFNDSESLGVELALLFEGKQKRINAIGDTAFICLQINKKSGKAKNLYFGRNEGNPLRYKDYKDMFALVSQGEGELIAGDTLYRYEYATGKTESLPLKIGEPSSSWGKYYNYYPYQSYPASHAELWDDYGDDDMENLLMEEQALTEQLKEARRQNDTWEIEHLEAQLTDIKEDIARYERESRQAAIGFRT